VQIALHGYHCEKYRGKSKPIGGNHHRSWIPHPLDAAKRKVSLFCDAQVHPSIPWCCTSRFGCHRPPFPPPSLLTYNDQTMSEHITIDGQTYASVDQMPPQVRRKYEAAMQMLAKNANAAATAGDPETNVDVTVQSGGDQPGAAFKTVTKMTTRRIVINGKEYHRLEDIPPAARATLHAAGINAAGDSGLMIGAAPTRRAIGHTSDRSTIGADLPTASSTTVTLGLGTLIVLLLMAVAAGLVIGWKFLH
jgi:hypothetical protein